MLPDSVDSLVKSDSVVTSTLVSLLYSCTARRTDSRKSFRFCADSLIASIPKLVLPLPL